MEKIFESKMTYLESESELDSNFAINSVSDFDSNSDSKFYEFSYLCFLYSVFLLF